MLTLNIDVEDKLTDGAIGVLKEIEEYVDGTTGKPCSRLWLEFPDKTVGRRRRLNDIWAIRPDLLDKKWVPIERRDSNIRVVGSIYSNRKQFPAVMACAMTIHKSQDRTYDQVVYQYHERHPQQLYTSPFRE